jgi:hypothetical protein
VFSRARVLAQATERVQAPGRGSRAKRDDLPALARVFSTNSSGEPPAPHSHGTPAAQPAPPTAFPCKIGSVDSAPPLSATSPYGSDGFLLQLVKKAVAAGALDRPGSSVGRAED